MADDIVVGGFAKNPREDVRVAISNFKGHDLVGVRVWFRDANDELRPSKAGVTVKVELLPELLRLLQAAKDVVIEKGMLDAEEFEFSEEADE